LTLNSYAMQVLSHTGEGIIHYSYMRFLYNLLTILLE